MLVKKILKGINVRLGLRLRAWWNWMAWHWNRQCYSPGILKALLAWFSDVMCDWAYNSGRNPLQPFCGGLSLWPAAEEAVIKFEQRLSDRVREGHPA